MAGDNSSTSRVERLVLSHFPHQPTESQLSACHLLTQFLFDSDPLSAFLLRGYAGTGKTSLVSALIQSAPALRIRTLLLAPTGRAAKVLSTYSHHPAYTIHKKIYTTVTDTSGNMRIARAQNKHSYTLFIVDEASMIGDTTQDGALFGHRSLLDDLLQYVAEGNHCRLLLLGDAAQLPPVGAVESPALLADRLLSVLPLKLFECELTDVVRQQSGSGILQNATGLRHQIAHYGLYGKVQLPLLRVEGFADVVRLPGEELEETLFRAYEEVGEEGVAFVCRSNKRANLFNQAIRSRILFREGMLNAGDYLLVVKNNYFWADDDATMSFVANGDIVEVLSARHFEEMYGFHFADVTARFVDYPDAPPLECKVLLETLHSESPSLTRVEQQQLFDAVMEDYADLPSKTARMQELKKNPYYNALQIKFAYALTCHKSQGGQWPIVFVDQGYMTDDMLDKDFLRWLYTAFTRATRTVYLLNFEERFFSKES